MALALGIGEEGCPPEEKQFSEFAESLPFSAMADYIASHEPMSDLHRFVDHGDWWSQVHRMRRWPEGLLVAGDALCRFNPIYAQGLTVGALHARALATTLGRGGGARDYHRRAARAGMTPWLMASSSDLMWDGGKGAGLPARLSHWHLGRVITRMSEDADLFRRFALVQHMLSGPATLSTPRVLWRLARRPGSPVQRQR
ncbi:hypothetical protein [Catenulispora pinisilvae]|uniref:hypothetical protein n=1 Tax=Catenulispora pinisilvae TaxID=2705253 RepID=UPI001891CD75|nr:hypothetical protein [Catenulispora pinisilvae]